MSAEYTLQTIHEDHFCTRGVQLASLQGLHPASRTQGEAQPAEQAGFRNGFNCMGHTQIVSGITVVCREQQLLLIIIFVDYIQEGTQQR